MSGKIRTKEIARGLVKFFAVRNTVNWAESLGTIVCTVRKFKRVFAKKRQLYHKTNFTLYNVLT